MKEGMIQLKSIIEKEASKYERSKYAMYLRKSRADLEMEALGEGETLARHKHMLEALASKHEIHPDQIVVYREVVSGDSITERPEMQRLLSDVYAKTYAGVLVVEVERLARGNTKDQGEVAEAFQYSDTKIITPMKVYNPNDEFDQEYFEFGLFMSRREYKTIKRRLDAGRLQAAQEGNYLGSRRIYGYDTKRIDKKTKILVPIPEEAKVVKMIFDWFTIDHMNSGQIKKKLEDMHIPTTSGNKEWSRAVIQDLIKNDHYAGFIRWNRRKTEKKYNQETGKMVKTRNLKKEYQLFQGKHEALVSKEQFDYAQTLFKGAAPINAAKKMVNPLSGLMICSECGKQIRMTIRTTQSKGTVSRFCHQESYICKKKPVYVETLMDALCASLNAYIDDFSIKMTNDFAQKERLEHHDMIVNLEKELEKKEKKRRSLFDKLEDGVYTNEEFIERKQIIGSDIDALKAQIKRMKEDMPEPVNYEEKIVQLHQLIDCIKDPNVDARAKNTFMKQVIEVIKFDSLDVGYDVSGQPVLDVYLK